VDAHRLFDYGSLPDRFFDQPIDFVNFYKRCDDATEVPGENRDFRSVVAVMRRFDLRMIVVGVMLLTLFDIEMGVDLSALRCLVSMKVRPIRQPRQQAGGAVQGR
jgi:hypothetical protein